MQSAIPPGNPAKIVAIGKSQGFKGLAVHFTTCDGDIPCLQTAWTPTPDEIARIVAGANIIVNLLTPQHPAILLEVGKVPE